MSTETEEPEPGPDTVPGRTPGPDPHEQPADPEPSIIPEAPPIRHRQV